METVHTSGGAPAATAEDIDLLKWVLLIWGRRNWILGSGLVFVVLGAIFAYTTTPVYRSEAIITPKTASTSSRVLSRLGGLGGIVATQIEAGNTPLDRLELIAKSRILARNMIVEHDLLPSLFPAHWDEKRREWKGGRPPNLDGAAVYMRSALLSVANDRRKDAMIMGIETYDPKLALRLIEIYLAGLNKAIRESVRKDADASRTYLEWQFAQTMDPQIRLKIEELIAQEIEKATLVSASAFDVIEPPWEPRSPIWPKKRQIIGIAFLLGLFLGIIGVIVFEKIRDFRVVLRARG